MARRSFRSGLVVGTLALAVLASSCGDSKESSSSDGSTSDSSGADTSGKLASADCGKLEYNADAPSGGTFTDYAYLSDSGTNTSFDPGVVQTPLGVSDHHGALRRIDRLRLQ